MSELEKLREIVSNLRNMDFKTIVDQLHPLVMQSEEARNEIVNSHEWVIASRYLRDTFPEEYAEWSKVPDRSTYIISKEDRKRVNTIVESWCEFNPQDLENCKNWFDDRWTEIKNSNESSVLKRELLRNLSIQLFEGLAQKKMKELESELA